MRSGAAVFDETALGAIRTAQLCATSALLALHTCPCTCCRSAHVSVLTTSWPTHIHNCDLQSLTHCCSVGQTSRCCFRCNSRLSLHPLLSASLNLRRPAVAKSYCMQELFMAKLSSAYVLQHLLTVCGSTGPARLSLCLLFACRSSASPMHDCSWHCSTFTRLPWHHPAYCLLAGALQGQAECCI